MQTFLYKSLLRLLKLSRVLKSLANWTPKIGDEETTLHQLQRAFKVWSDYAHLKFVRVPTPDADIVILFGRGYHGDR